MCADPSKIDLNGNCQFCDTYRGFWATGLSLNKEGRVTGNICEYDRITDMTRTPHWILGAFGFLVIFVGVVFISIFICCYISKKAVVPSNLTFSRNHLEADLAPTNQEGDQEMNLVEQRSTPR